jgi:hypothetical protein
LKSATEWLADMLDIQVAKGRIVEEQHDFSSLQWREWAWMQLDKRPVHELKSIVFKFGPTQIFEVPLSWCRLVIPEAGQVQIVPSASDLQKWPLQQFVYMGYFNFALFDKIPGWYVATYDAGYDVPFEEVIDHVLREWTPPSDLIIDGMLEFELPQSEGTPKVTVTGTDNVTGLAATEIVTLSTVEEPGDDGATYTGKSTRGWSAVTSVTYEQTAQGGGQVGNLTIRGNFIDATNRTRYKSLPNDLLELGGKIAAGWPLGVAGDLIAGAGTSSRTTNVDGASTSLVTTASATYTGYGARIQQLMREVKLLLPIVRRKYHGIKLAVA